MRRSTVFGVGSCFVLLAMVAPLQAVDLVAERIFEDDAGNTLPPTHVVIRVWWEGPSADDRLLAVLGSPVIPMQIDVSGGTFHDSSHVAAGDRPPLSNLLSVPGFEPLRVDSWLTVGASSINVGPGCGGEPFTDLVNITDGTNMEPVLDGSVSWQGGEDGPDGVSWTVGPDPECCLPGCVAPQALAGNWPDRRVLLLQLSIVPDGSPGDVVISGSLGLLVIIDELALQIPATFFLTTKVPCPADVTGDGTVGVNDLTQVLLNWSAPGGPADVNGDGIVAVLDLVEVIANWGPCG